MTEVGWHCSVLSNLGLKSMSILLRCAALLTWELLVAIHSIAGLVTG